MVFSIFVLVWVFFGQLPLFLAMHVLLVTQLASILPVSGRPLLKLTANKMELACGHFDKVRVLLPILSSCSAGR